MRDPGKRRGTSTSAFGVSGRESHDSSGFYERFTMPEVSKDSDVSAASRAIDEIFVGTSAAMDQVETNSVALVVTSPPYFAGKAYETALGEGHIPSTYVEYLEMLTDVFRECVRTLEPGGRIAVNVANLGRKPYRSLSADVINILQDRLRLLLRGEVVWVKAQGASGSCAWGSFQSPANPVLRDLSERVIIASKGRFDRARNPRQRDTAGLPSEASIFRDEFMEATTDIWEIPPESASRVGHPAPFPVELPERLIHLHTYRGDLVLDPFMGSGTTAVAALRTGRHYVGYDTDAAYVAAAQARADAEAARLGRRPEPGPLRVALPSRPVPADDDIQARGVREGRAAKQLAHDLLAASGFEKIRDKVTLPGVDVTFAARDAQGREWFFEVSGGYTSSRPGLRRNDTLWKALGKAAVLHAIRPEVPLVLLTTEVPTPGSAGHLALRAVTDDDDHHDRPIHAVVVLHDATALPRLTAFATGSGH